MGSENRLVRWLEILVTTVIGATLIFGLFHLYVYLFSVTYKAAFLFHYLP